MPDAKRLDYLDITKGIGILLVLLGHLIDTGIVKYVIYSFHMPLFFLVSGMLLKPEPVMVKLKKRVSEIVVPYFVWAFVFAGFSWRKVVMIFYGTQESLWRENGNAMLWFLVSMFFATIISQKCIGIFNKNRHKYVILSICLIISLVLSKVLHGFHDSFAIAGFHPGGLPWSADIVFLSVPFMLFGYMISGPVKKFAGTEPKWWQLCVALPMIFASLLSVFNKVSGKSVPSMGSGHVGNYAVFFALACISVIGIIIFSVYVEKSKLISIPLIWLGQNSMGLYIMHRMVRNEFVDFYASHHSIIVLMILYAVMIIFSITGTIIVTKFCPELFGRSRYKLIKE